nr:DUF3780 domain-containing protein [uncultured Noviherbaspirillum sp.]
MSQAKPPQNKKPSALGFGFQPELSEHYFLLTLPRSKNESAEITLSEHFEWFAPNENTPIPVPLNATNAHLRVILKRGVWDMIAEDVKAEFNRRLRVYGQKTAKWPQLGQVPIDRTLGKELCVLAWAVEECDPALISIAIRNWLGLVPEERWWLYTMTNAATGHALAGRGKGWRKALRYALTENPVSEGLIQRRLAEFELVPNDSKT